MGILDFFRKKRKKEKTQETEIKPEEISFNEIGSWLDGKIN
jgi:hypothetical protein